LSTSTIALCCCTLSQKHFYLIALPGPSNQVLLHPHLTPLPLCHPHQCLDHFLLFLHHGPIHLFLVFALLLEKLMMDLFNWYVFSVICLILHILGVYRKGITITSLFFFLLGSLFISTFASGWATHRAAPSILLVWTFTSTFTRRQFTGFWLLTTVTISHNRNEVWKSHKKCKLHLLTSISNEVNPLCKSVVKTTVNILPWVDQELLITSFYQVFSVHVSNQLCIFAEFDQNAETPEESKSTISLVKVHYN